MDDKAKTIKKRGANHGGKPSILGWENGGKKS